MRGRFELLRRGGDRAGVGEGGHHFAGEALDIAARAAEIDDDILDPAGPQRLQFAADLVGAAKDSRLVAMVADLCLVMLGEARPVVAQPLGQAVDPQVALEAPDIGGLQLRRGIGEMHGPSDRDLHRVPAAAAGRRYDPMQVGVARAVHFADTPEELEAAYVRRFQGHLRINRLAERPGDDRARFAEHNEAAIRHHCDETAVFGTTDQICRKLEALRAGGVEYVIVNFGGSRQNIRRFARDVMPAFADTRPVAVAAK